MKYFFFLLFFVTYSIYSQESTIEVHGNNNVVRVVQGGNIKEYNLSDEKQNKAFLKYLEGFPEFSKDIKAALYYSRRNHQQLKKLTAIAESSGVLNPSKFLEEFAKMAVENNKLKEEIQTLKKQTKDVELSRILDKANKLLDAFDNKGYQQLLQEFKQSQQSSIAKKNRELAQVSYLQSQNNRLNFSFDQAMVQINEALLIEPDNPDFLHEVGKIYFDKCAYDIALSCFYETLQIKELSLGKDNPSTASVYNDVGLVYLKQKNDVLALDYFLKALAIFEKTLGKENFSTADTYNNIGLVYEARNEYDLALDYFQKAIAIFEKALGKEHANTANSYYKIGHIYKELQNYGCAIEYFQKAMVIKEKELGAQNSSTADTYHSLGQAYFQTENWEMALEYYKKTIAVYEKVFGAESSITGDCYMEIGLAYDEKEEHKPAIEYYLKAIKTLESKKHEDGLAAAYSKIASEYYDLENFKLAIEYYNKALPIQERILSKESIVLNASYFFIGLSYISDNQHMQGINYLNKRIAYDEKIGDENKNVLLISNMYIGIAYFEQNDYKNAIKYLEETSSLFTDESLFDDLTKSDINALVAALYAFEGEGKIAGQYFKNLELDEKFTDDPIDILIEAGESVMEEQQYKAAINAFEFALKLLEAENNSKNPQWAETYHCLANAYCSSGKKKKAMQMFDKGILSAIQNEKDAKKIADDYAKCQTDKMKP